MASLGHAPGRLVLVVSAKVRLASAYEDYRHKRYDSARIHLQGLVDPKAAHLLGMVSRKQGRLVEAREHLEWAAARASEDTEIATSLGQLYQELKKPGLAEDAYRRVLNAKPSAVTEKSARLGLAAVLTDCSRVEDALDVLEALPANNDVANHLRGRALLESGDLDAAQAVLLSAFESNPGDAVLQTLAQAYWLAGKSSDFDALIVKASRIPGLGAAAVGVARSSNKFDWAWDVGLGVAADKENATAFRTAMATLAVDRGDAQSALALAGDVVRSNPTFGPAVGAVISAQLMLGSTDKAELLIKRMREAEPLGQHWIGYQLVAARQRGADVTALTSALVGVYDLPVPEGFASLDAFNAAFADTLRRLHASKQQPLGQSLRGGTQTARNLATYEDSVVQAYLDALRKPVAEHLAHIGSDNANPCSARNTGEFAINDCWSVTLEKGDYHQSHVHPEGWLSSAYYVSVPKDATSDSREGWLKFGEPPIVLPDAQSVLEWVEPQPGRLALFPSYLWHSTEPVAAGGERLTAPFDVVPA